MTWRGKRNIIQVTKEVGRDRPNEKERVGLGGGAALQSRAYMCDLRGVEMGPT